MKTIKAVGYLEVRATRATWISGKPINGAKIEKLTKGRPSRIDGDSVVLQLEVSIPESLFERFARAEVSIPERVDAGESEIVATFDQDATEQAKAVEEPEESFT